MVALRIGIRSPELSALYREHGAASMAFLTACNPLGAVVADGENERAMALLRSDVEALGLVALPGTGRDGQPGQPVARRAQPCSLRDRQGDGRRAGPAAPAERHHVGRRPGCARAGDAALTELPSVGLRLSQRACAMTDLRQVLNTERRKALALGMFEERNLEGDDEMVIGESGPLPPNAKWPFPKPPYSAAAAPVRRRRGRIANEPDVLARRPRRRATRNRTTTMPLKKMTREEVKAWLGSGLVLPAQKPLLASKQKCPAAPAETKAHAPAK